MCRDFSTALLVPVIRYQTVLKLVPARPLVPLIPENLSTSTPFYYQALQYDTGGCLFSAHFFRSEPEARHLRIFAVAFTNITSAMAAAGRTAAKVLGINLDYRREEPLSGAASISSVETCR
jgi:hypothetical protein